MKTLWILFIILLTTAALATAEIAVTDKLVLRKNEDVKAGVQTLCIDGQKFVLAYGWSAMSTVQGVGAGGGVNVIQVYEEKNGKVVPAKCKS